MRGGCVGDSSLCRRRAGVKVKLCGTLLRGERGFGGRKSPG